MNVGRVLPAGVFSVEEVREGEVFTKIGLATVILAMLGDPETVVDGRILYEAGGVSYCDRGESDFMEKLLQKVRDEVSKEWESSSIAAVKKEKTLSLLQSASQDLVVFILQTVWRLSPSDPSYENDKAGLEGMFCRALQAGIKSSSEASDALGRLNRCATVCFNFDLMLWERLGPAGDAFASCEEDMKKWSELVQEERAREEASGTFCGGKALGEDGEKAYREDLEKVCSAMTRSIDAVSECEIRSSGSTKPFFEFVEESLGGDKGFLPLLQQVQNWRLALVPPNPEGVLDLGRAFDFYRRSLFNLAKEGLKYPVRT